MGLQLCLGAMQKLAVEAPEGSRCFLQDNPQLCYALLHAQLLLGLDTDVKVPASQEEMMELRAEAARRPTMFGNMAPGMGMMPFGGVFPCGMMPFQNMGRPYGPMRPRYFRQARPNFATTRAHLSGARSLLARLAVQKK